MAIDAAGNLYVADTGNHRIQVFSLEGVFLRQFGSFGGEDGKLVSPEGIAFHDGTIYVTDAHHRVQAFSESGAFLCLVGSFGGVGENGHPEGVAIGPGGSIFVADRLKHRVVKFGPESTPAARATLGQVKHRFR